MESTNTEPAPNAGTRAYDLWVGRGMSAPVDMDMGAKPLVPSRPGDVNLDGITNLYDLLGVVAGWGPCPAPPSFCPTDLNFDGRSNITDLLAVVAGWGG